MKKVYLVWIGIILIGCSNAAGQATVKVMAPGTNQVREEFTVELAQTNAERQQGLMYRDHLGADRGMLFIWTELTHGSFWMHNTLIPLDIIFLGPDKKIINIVANAEPQTDTPRSPAGDYQYVLEIEGGRAQALGIVPGDSVEFNL